MKKTIKYIPWILLGIALITIGFFAFSLNSMKLDAIQQIKNIQAVEEKFQATQNANVARLETLKVVLDKAQAERDVYAEQLQAAEDSLACTNRDLFKPNYLDDASMSKAISEFLATTERGEFKAESWDVLWEGSKTALFTITMTLNNNEVGYKFFIYHNDAYFKKNRVFSIDKQCWLDG
jgi:hypothetical protein